MTVVLAGSANANATAVEGLTMTRYYTLEEAADVLGISAEELRLMAKQKKISGVEDRGTWRFREEDVRQQAGRAPPFQFELATLPPERSGHIFISYVEEDGELAARIADALEGEGYVTWYYQRDSLPGTDYLKVTGEAIESCQAVVLLISPQALDKANQVTKEVVRGHECGKQFVPILRGVSHAEFQKRQPGWRQALGAASSIAVPAEGVPAILPRLVGGLRHLGIAPGPAAAKPRPVSTPQPGPAPRPPAARFQGEARRRSWGEHIFLEATDGTDGRPVLIKRLTCDWRDYDHHLDLLRWEAEILQALHDSPLTPRFVAFYERPDEPDESFEADEGVGFSEQPDELEDIFKSTEVHEKSADLVLERLPREDLTAALKKEGRGLPLKLVVRWGAQLCELLRRMQQLSPPWSHGGIRPDKLFLLEDGATLRVDFAGSRPTGEGPRPKRRPVKALSGVRRRDPYKPDDRGNFSLEGRPNAEVHDAEVYGVTLTLYYLATGGPPSEELEEELTANLASASCPYPERDRWFFELVGVVMQGQKGETFESIAELQAALEQRRSRKPGGAGLSPVTCPRPDCRSPNARADRYCAQCGTAIPHPAGTVLNRHIRVDRLLARGGFSFIYLATDQKSGAQLVVKDMHCEDRQELAIRLGFFRREAQVLALLRGVGSVPRCYGLYEKNDTARLFLEHVAGQDLIEVMRGNDGRPFPFDLVVGWGKALCDVLQALHDLRPPWVYRDLKPDQIMLLPDGRTIRLLDFGTAREAGKPGARPNTTRVATEGFSAPEQAAGRALPRSDLFSLAATLYQLVTGHVPDGTGTADRLAKALSGESCPYPAEQRWFFELLRVNLAKNFHDRYFSCADFKADLERRQFTRLTRCPECRHESAAREPFCCRCAAPLTGEAPPCEGCGQANRLGARVCIRCDAALWY